MKLTAVTVKQSTLVIMVLKLCSNEHKVSLRNCDFDKNEIAKHCWESDHNFS